MANSNDGVLLNGAKNNVIGSGAPGAANVIAGNGSNGIEVHGASGYDATGNFIRGNYVGELSDAMAIANVGDGVLFDAVTGYSAFDNTLGGSGVGEGNVIGYNGGFGVRVAVNTIGSGNGDALSANSISSNTKGGIALTVAGANNNQAAPHLAGAMRGGSVVNVTGSFVNAGPNAILRVEYFSSSACDPTGYGQGNSFLGAAQVMTDAAGSATFNDAISSAVAPGQVITATATDSLGDTSTFSNCVTVTASPSVGGLASAPDPAQVARASGDGGRERVLLAGVVIATALVAAAGGLYARARRPRS